MTFAKPGILRLIPSGPNPVIWDYQQLLAGKLRAAWDAREGGEFAPGLWVSHRDVVSGLRVVAPSDAERPLCVADGSNFRGQRVIGITQTNNRRMVTQAMPNVVPVAARPEVFMVARLPNGAAQSGNLCGCADAGAGSTAGASLWANGSGGLNAIVGSVAMGAAYADTANVHLFTAANEGATSRFLIDNAPFASTTGAGAALATTQAAVGGFATGFTATVNAFVALWGIVCPAMTDAERAQLLEIARNDWAF
jgi:hypothetical protein